MGSFWWEPEAWVCDSVTWHHSERIGGTMLRAVMWCGVYKSADQTGWLDSWARCCFPWRRPLARCNAPCDGLSVSQVVAQQWRCKELILLLRFFIFTFCLWVLVCMCMYHASAWCSCGPAADIGFPGTGVTMAQLWTNMWMLWIQPELSEGASGITHWAIIPAPWWYYS